MSNAQVARVKTKNVQHSIAQYAQENVLELKACDFTLKKVETLVRDVHNMEFVAINKELLESYLEKERIVDEHVEFAQIYTIDIFPKEKASPLELLCKVKEGPYAYEPKLLISPKSKIPTEQFTPKEMLLLLYKELNKIKLLNGFLINIFDTEMKKNLQSFIKYLYNKKFTKTLQISLFSGIAPVVTRESKLIFWYKQKEGVSQIIEVNAGEVLVEFKKPIYGKNGLSAYGKEISMASADNSKDLEVAIDEKTIVVEENEDKKLYKSRVQGFVHFHNNLLSIDNKIKMDTISRNTATIASEEDNNVEIIVSQHDDNRDSIGEGVELISEFIHVDGFVGAKSKLEATKLKIDGATHQEATQIAKYATINRHKGKLRCHEAKIELLEGGEVIATKVEVASSLGGTIYAQDVVLGHVKNNLKVYASHSITVRLVSGEDNSFTINLHKVPIITSKLKFIENDIENLKYDIEEANRHKPEKAKELLKEIQSLNEERESILHSYKDAFISIKKPLSGLTIINFHIDAEHELTYRTDAKSYEKFHLEIDENKITLLPVHKSITIE